MEKKYCIFLAINVIFLTQISTQHAYSAINTEKKQNKIESI